MSLIACTSNCFYQRDGYCTLDKATATGPACNLFEACVNYRPDHSQNSAERFPNISDTDQL